MSLFDQSTLAQFTGTERYYRISKRHLLTDGTKYLAEQAECFWMMDAIASHLAEIGTTDLFVAVKTTVNDAKALMVYEDGNGHEHARQEIPYTDLPIAAITLYAWSWNWNGRRAGCSFWRR